MERRRDLVAILLIFAAITLWFGNVLFTGETYFIKDLFRYHYAMKEIVAQAIKSGEFPYWSPFYGAGQPLAANPAYELFYPPQWLVLLPNFRLGFTLHIVLHAYLCALGLYLLLRSLGCSGVSAAFGTIAFVLGGPLLSLIRLLPFLFAATWMPWIFLFARRWLLTRSRRDFLLAALFGGLQALIAEPTMLIQTWLLVAAYAAYRAWRDRRADGWWRNAVAVALLVAASLVVAAAQIIPTFDFARDSVRSRPLDYDVVSYSSMVPVRPLELLYPSVFQSTITSLGVSRIRTLYPNGEPFLANLYLGVAVAVLFFAGLFAWRRGSGLVLAICAVSYVIALGANTPLLRILYGVGIFRSIRYPEKFALGAMITIAIWAALTLERLLRGDRDVAKWALRVLLGWGALALLMLTFSYSVSAEGAFWVRTLLRGGAVAAIVWAIRRQPSWIWGAALVIVTLLDVRYLQHDLNPTMPPRFFDPPPVARQLAPEKGAYRVFHSAEWDWAYEDPKAEAFFGSSYGPWWFIRDAMMPRTTPTWGYRMALDQDYDETFLLPTADLVQSMRDVRDARKTDWERPFLAMSNAWYTSRFRDFASEEKRTGGNVEQMMPVDFIPAPERYPRYYFADQIEQSGSREMFVQKLLSRTWSPRVAFVPFAPFPPAPGTVRVLRETMSGVTLEAAAPARALLVLSITPHKYWRATIDGRAAALQPANVGYQCLEVPPGKHTIAMTYANPLVVVGIVISVLALIAIGVGAFTTPFVPLPPEAPEPTKPEPTPIRVTQKKRRARS